MRRPLSFGLFVASFLSSSADLEGLRAVGLELGDKDLEDVDRREVDLGEGEGEADRRRRSSSSSSSRGVGINILKSWGK